MRDEFSKEVLDVLAKRVGHRCSNPGCDKQTTGPRTEPDKSVSIGVGAHIAAASPGGPRYDESQSSRERGSAENGIWLCQNCAKLIDNDACRYSVKLLQEWKQRAEQLALSRVEGNGADLDTAFPGPFRISVDYKRVSITADHHDYELEVTVENLGDRPIYVEYAEAEMPTPVLESPENHAHYVAGRSDADGTLLRAVFDGDGERLFPGDTMLAICTSYYMDHKLSWRKGTLDKTIRASVRVSGYPVATVMKSLAKLQCF